MEFERSDLKGSVSKRRRSGQSPETSNPRASKYHKRQRCDSGASSTKGLKHRPPTPQPLPQSPTRTSIENFNLTFDEPLSDLLEDLHLYKNNSFSNFDDLIIYLESDDREINDKGTFNNILGISEKSVNDTESGIESDVGSDNQAWSDSEGGGAGREMRKEIEPEKPSLLRKLLEMPQQCKPLHQKQKQLQLQPHRQQQPLPYSQQHRQHLHQLQPQQQHLLRQELLPKQQQQCPLEQPQQKEGHLLPQEQKQHLQLQPHRQQQHLPYSLQHGQHLLQTQQQHFQWQELLPKQHQQCPVEQPQQKEWHLLPHEQQQPLQIQPHRQQQHHIYSEQHRQYLLQQQQCPLGKPWQEQENLLPQELFPLQKHLIPHSPDLQQQLQPKQELLPWQQHHHQSQLQPWQQRHHQSQLQPGQQQHQSQQYVYQQQFQTQQQRNLLIHHQQHHYLNNIPELQKPQHQFRFQQQLHENWLFQQKLQQDNQLQQYPSYPQCLPHFI